MKFDIEREESYSFDFVKENMDNILACIARRDKYFKLHYNERKEFYQSTFDLSGLITGGIKPRPSWQYELSDFWEGFAEFLLQGDFKFCNYGDFPPSEEIEEEVKELYSKCFRKRHNILFDIIKRKYEFEDRPSKYQEVEVIEKNGVKFYALTFTEFVLYLPKDEIDKTEVMTKLNHIRQVRREKKLTFALVEWMTRDSFLERLLTPDEQDEYYKRCNEIQECIEAKIKIVEDITNSYKLILVKNNIMLSPEESQLLKECFMVHSEALDFFGIKKPTTSFSYPKPFYFIEVKSSNKRFGGRLSAPQKRVVEQAKSKFGVLILHIKVEPHDVTVRYLSPK